MAKKRAKTDMEKQEIIERLFILWTKGDNYHLRFGQLIGNVIRDEAVLYNIEDFDLIEKLEKGYEKNEGKNI